MLKAPHTATIDRPPLKSTLSMPYTLTPGRATGSFLAEIKAKRILGSRFRTSGKICVPAQDFCPDTGDSTFDFVLAPETGTLAGFTETDAGVIGLIRMDGSDFDLTHQLVDCTFDALSVGMRVAAVWAEGGDGILAIAGFKPAPGAAVGTIEPVAEVAPAIEMVPYKLDLHYEHAFGPYYGRLFDEIETNGRIVGVRTPEGEGVLIPPREFCDTDYRRTGTWAALPDTGTVRAMSVIHLEFKGQKHPPPYIYAEIMLDGAATRLIHNVAGIDMSRAKDLVKPGTRVRAVWRDTRTGSLDDISHFEPIPDGEA